MARTWAESPSPLTREWHRKTLLRHVVVRWAQPGGAWGSPMTLSVRGRLSRRQQAWRLRDSVRSAAEAERIAVLALHAR